MKAGDIVLYKRRGCDSYELGVVKSVLDDGSAFVWYSGGDTAARTPADCLFGFDNSAASVVSEHAGHGTCRFELDETEGERRCSSCGEFVTQHSADMEYFVTELTAEAFTHCPFCGAKVVER